MHAHQSVPVFLILLAAVMTCGTAHPAPAVSDVRVVATGPTHLQIDWQGQAEAYRIVYSEAIASAQHTSPVLAKGPFTLVDLVPETEYVVKVQALEPSAEGAQGDAFRVIGENQTPQVSTKPWQPREWEDLLLWPSRHVPTFPSGARDPVIAAHGDELLVVECYEGAIYVSRVNPQTLEVRPIRLSLPAEEALSRTDLDAVVIKDTLWVTWVSAYTNVKSYNPAQVLTSYDLQTETVSKPAKLHRTSTCGLVAFNWDYRYRTCLSRRKLGFPVGSNSFRPPTASSAEV